MLEFIKAVLGLIFVVATAVAVVFWVLDGPDNSEKLIRLGTSGHCRDCGNAVEVG